MSAYYNENDPFAAAWLRELIKADLIAKGEVDERSIEAVSADDVRGFRQCHFFAGIGGWSYALRLAGWPDDRAVWTGSCPCQPFSAAGKGAGAADSRHLWPTWFRLISESGPHVVFGEQVASVDGLGWFDRVSTDLEGAGYAVGALDLCAASVGAFHIRQRLWFVAESDQRRRRPDGEYCRSQRASNDGPLVPHNGSAVADASTPSELADAEAIGLRQGPADTSRRDEGTGSEGARLGPSDDSCVGGLADPKGRDFRRHSGEPRDKTNARGGEARPQDGHAVRSAGGVGVSRVYRRVRDRSNATGDLSDLRASRIGAWDACDWLPCIDGKARPVEPGTFPLAHGVSARVGRLRGYGNAIVPQVAQAFIEAYMSIPLAPPGLPVEPT